MADILIVYYSRSGTTETVARALASRLGAELEAVRPLDSYAGRRGYWKGIAQCFGRRRPAIAETADPVGYRLVVIGAPVWGGGLAAPMRSYLAARGRQARGFAAFCVSGGGGRNPGFFDEIQALGSERPRPILALSQIQVLNGDYQTAMEGFERQIRERLSAAG